MDKTQIKKMLDDCIEWAEATCDTITVGEFFRMLEINSQSSGYNALIKEFEKEGVFDEE